MSKAWKLQSQWRGIVCVRALHRWCQCGGGSPRHHGADEAPVEFDAGEVHPAAGATEDAHLVVGSPRHVRHLMVVPAERAHKDFANGMGRHNGNE